MADRFDVAARLAEGRPAVEHTQSYVRACHVLGYQHPDLTSHGSQVRDWYDSEDGLDLRVLDDDCAALWSMVSTLEEALRAQRAQGAELATAWTGSGADSALGLLQRHGEAAAAVAAGVCAAAEGCGSLRDRLWQLIDRKVAAAIAIDDRSYLQRPAWLAAAEQVTAGPGAHSTADPVGVPPACGGVAPACWRLIDEQVKPYVDSDIRTDWLTAMRSTLTSVAASYDAIVDGLSSAPPAHFPIPGGFDLNCQPLLDGFAQPAATTVSGPVASVLSSPADTAPAGYAGMPAAAAQAAVPPTSPMPPPPVGPAAESTNPVGGLEAAPLTSPMPTASELGTALGDLPAGAGDLGGLPAGAGGLDGLGGLVGRIAEVIGGLLGSLTDGLAGSSEVGGSLSESDPFEQAEEADDGQAGDADSDPAAQAEQAEDVTEDGAEAGEGAGADEADSPAPPPLDDETPASEVTGSTVDAPAPAGTPPPAGTAPVVTPEPASEESTPCEIAADQLPQAGQ